MLKALGLTIWGLIAFGLLVVFMFVGYQAAFKHRASTGSVVDARTASPHFGEALRGPPGDTETVTPSAPIPGAPASSSPPPMLDATHQLLRSAAENHQYDMVIWYDIENHDMVVEFR